MNTSTASNGLNKIKNKTRPIYFGSSLIFVNISMKDINNNNNIIKNNYYLLLINKFRVKFIVSLNK